MKRIILLVIVVVALIGTTIAVSHKSIKTHEVGLRSVGNNNWQLWCHYTYSNNSTSNKYIATLNTNTGNYSTAYKQAADQC